MPNARKYVLAVTRFLLLNLLPRLIACKPNLIDISTATMGHISSPKWNLERSTSTNTKWQSLLMMKYCFSISTDQSICPFHRSSISQNQIWVWRMFSMILIDFMIAIAQKTGYCGGKTKKINENVARVCYKRISNCSIRRVNLFND